MTEGSDNRHGHAQTAAQVAVLTERLENVEERLVTIETLARKVALFADECTGGRKAMLLLLKVAGTVAGMIGVGWAIFHAMWKAKVGA